MLKKVGEVAIIVMVAVNACELASYFAMRRAGGLYAAHQQFPLPSGYSPSGRYVAPKAAPCYLIRVTAKGCEFCRADQGEFAVLLGRAQEARCETVAVSPVASAAEPNTDSRIVQLQYVDMKFGRALNPFMTPETILLDGAGRVVWFRAGTMDKRSLADAIRALGKLH